jgi:hypothetical protein
VATYLRLIGNEAVTDRRVIGDSSPIGCKVVSKRVAIIRRSVAVYKKTCRRIAEK